MKKIAIAIVIILTIQQNALGCAGNADCHSNERCYVTNKSNRCIAHNLLGAQAAVDHNGKACSKGNPCGKGYSCHIPQCNNNCNSVSENGFCVTNEIISSINEIAHDSVASTMKIDKHHSPNSGDFKCQWCKTDKYCDSK